MADPITLTFESSLRASRDAVWDWMTSVRGISLELKPFFRMTVPAGVESLADVQFEPDKPLFRSRVLLFGLLPIGYSDLTLLELTPGDGFVEQSPMASMDLWRHERRIQNASVGDTVTLVDRLTFEPKHARDVIAWFIRKVFEHRHRVLRANFGDAGVDSAA
jgi:ligand-binding SRPBCC domain-containing protein